MKYAILLLVVVISCLMAAGVFILVDPHQTEENHPIVGEVINITLIPEPDDKESKYAGLPGPGNYTIFANTLSRDDPPAVVAFAYTYWYNTSTTDRFGTTWNNITVQSPWSIYWDSGIGTVGNLGQTDSNTIVNTTFSVPSEALTAGIHVRTQNSEIRRSSRVHIVVKEEKK